jgi:hypothetical protein
MNFLGKGGVNSTWEDGTRLRRTEHCHRRPAPPPIMTIRGRTGPRQGDEASIGKWGIKKTARPEREGMASTRGAPTFDPYPKPVTISPTRHPTNPLSRAPAYAQASLCRSTRQERGPGTKNQRNHGTRQANEEGIEEEQKREKERGPDHHTCAPFTFAVAIETPTRRGWREERRGPHADGPKRDFWRPTTRRQHTQRNTQRDGKGASVRG